MCLRQLLLYAQPVFTSLVYQIPLCNGLCDMIRLAPPRALAQAQLARIIDPWTGAMDRSNTPRYQSTRGGQRGLTFEQAVFEGLAQDGGLLVPEWIPDVSGVFKDWAKMSFDEVAYEIVSRYSTEVQTQPRET